MSNITDFLAENVKPAIDKAEIKLERFKSPFVVKTITQEENDALQKAHKRTRIAKGGRRVTDLDSDAYTDSLMTACILVPDLKNADLQKSYGTQGDEAGTLKAMLTIGEYAELSEKILEINGFDDEEELVEDVKK